MDETSYEKLIRRLSELNIRQEREITQVTERHNKERKDLIDKRGRQVPKIDGDRRPIKTRQKEDPDGVALSIGSQVTLLMSGVTGKLGNKNRGY